MARDSNFEFVTSAEDITTTLSLATGETQTRVITVPAGPTSEASIGIDTNNLGIARLQYVCVRNLDTANRVVVALASSGTDMVVAPGAFVLLHAPADYGPTALTLENPNKTSIDVQVVMVG